MDYETRTPTSIAYVKQHVENRLDWLARLIGGEVVRLHKEMREHVAGEVGALRQVIDEQRKANEALEHRLRSVEAMFAPSSSKDASDRRRYS